jgi:hypothetical protein
VTATSRRLVHTSGKLVGALERADQGTPKATRAILIGERAVSIAKFSSALDDRVAEGRDAVDALSGPFERDQVAAPEDDVELAPSISATTWLCISSRARPGRTRQR